MEVKFLSQPLASSDGLETFMDGLSSPSLDRITIVSAWAKRSGLARIADRLAAFRARGGNVELIVGVSEGGATKEGLELAMDLADEAFVFHHPGRTFHPKVYLATGVSQRELLVGSSNMTAGGLGWNHEASVWIRENDSTPSQAFSDAQGWITTLKLQPMSCKKLDVALLDALLASAELRIGTETSARRPRSLPDSPEDSDSSSVGSVGGLFSAPAIHMRPLSPLPSSTSKTAPPGSTTAASTPSTPSTTPAASSGSTVVRRWFRQLDNTAAQLVKGPRSNPTGNLRLTQSSHGIRHETYFYSDLFGGLPWAPTPTKATEQELIVDFDCFDDATHLGIEPLRISHDPTRISGQANVPSVLHWGRSLGARLRAGNYVGRYLTIERLADGTFRLTLSSSPSGPFIA
jgi:hypothetical protein